MECYSYSVKGQPAWPGAEKPKVNPVPFIPFWAAASIQGQLHGHGAEPGPDQSPPGSEAGPASPGGAMQPMPAHYQHALHQGMLVPQEHYGLPPITSANNTPFLGAALRPQQYMVTAPAAHSAPAAELSVAAEAMPGQGEDLTARIEVQAHKSQPSSEPVASKGRELFTEDEDGQEVVYRGSAEHLARHGRGEKVDRVYDCDGCDKAFTREEHMKRHAKQHTDEPEHKCDIPDGTTGRICDKKFTRRERLTRHIKVVHLGEVPERPFWCNHCGKDFQRKEHMERHQRNIHGPGGSAEIEESDEMEEMEGSPRMDGSPGMDESQPAPLPVATRQLPLPRVRQERMDSLDDSGSNSAGTLHCTYSDCTKSFSKKQSLERHLKQHLGIEPDRPYSCSDCWKTFTRKEHMLRHQRGHTGETPFSCTEVGCAKKFNRKEHLKRHLLIHSGEHPYPCSECGRSFGRTERLRKHMKSHGIDMLDPLPQAKPKSEPVLKKEPIFTQESNSSQGVFGSQTSELLKMMKGPLSPEQQLAHRQAQAYAQAQVLAKLPAFSSSPTKQTTTAADTLPASQPAVTSSSMMMSAVPSVAAELSKLPSTVSYFAVAGQGGMPAEHVTNGFYQAAAPAGYVATTMAGRPGELATLPINWPVNWQMAHMQPAGMVNLRSPGKADGTEAAYASFRPSFS